MESNRLRQAGSSRQQQAVSKVVAGSNSKGVGVKAGSSRQQQVVAGNEAVAVRKVGSGRQ